MSSESISDLDFESCETLESSSTIYSVLEYIGEGSFGKVAKCRNLQTGEAVAIKILKDRVSIKDAEHEVSILKTISVLNPDTINVVRFFEQFEDMGQTCLAFEMLEVNLFSLIKRNNREPLHLGRIRPIAKQLFVALDALMTLGILHTDIKPDNIMLVREQEESIRVKLIDFGLAIPADKVQQGMKMQNLAYRAPEVCLGLPITTAVDMWAVGCVLAFLFMGKDLFENRCPYQSMRRLIEILGLPDHLLWSGLFTDRFFTMAEDRTHHDWRLLTPEEFARMNGFKPKLPNESLVPMRSLDDLVNIHPHNAAETEDTKDFVDLMKGLLHLDGLFRLKPSQALQHSFITMTPMSQDQDFSDSFSKEEDPELAADPSLPPLVTLPGEATAQASVLEGDVVEEEVAKETELTEPAMIDPLKDKGQSSSSQTDDTKSYPNETQSTDPDSPEIPPSLLVPLPAVASTQASVLEGDVVEEKVIQETEPAMIDPPEDNGQSANSQANNTRPNPNETQSTDPDSPEIPPSLLVPLPAVASTPASVLEGDVVEEKVIQETEPAMIDPPEDNRQANNTRPNPDETQSTEPDSPEIPPSPPVPLPAVASTPASVLEGEVVEENFTREPAAQTDQDAVQAKVPKTRVQRFLRWIRKRFCCCVLPQADT